MGSGGHRLALCDQSSLYSQLWTCVLQARLTRDALANFPFKACFASTIKRAEECANIMWEGREGPLVHMDDLREANLGYLQGMTNSYAQEHHPEVYGAFRPELYDGLLVPLEYILGSLWLAQWLGQATPEFPVTAPRRMFRACAPRAFA